MCSMPLCPSGFFQFDGKSPDGEGRCQFIIAKDQFFKHIHDQKNRNKALETLLLPQVADDPAGIWKDLKSPEKSKWLAYARVPDQRRIANVGIEVPWDWKENKTLVFYVRDLRGASGQLVIDYWESLDEADQTDPANKSGFPINHLTRYGTRLWPAD